MDSFYRNDVRVVLLIFISCLLMEMDGNQVCQLCNIETYTLIEGFCEECVIHVIEEIEQYTCAICQLENDTIIDGLCNCCQSSC